MLYFLHLAVLEDMFLKFLFPGNDYFNSFIAKRYGFTREKLHGSYNIFSYF